MLNILSRLFTTLAAAISRLSPKAVFLSSWWDLSSLEQNPHVSQRLFPSPGEQRCATAAPTRGHELWWVQLGIVLTRTWEGENIINEELRGFAGSTWFCSPHHGDRSLVSPGSSDNCQLLLLFQTGGKSSQPQQHPSTVAGILVALVLPNLAPQPLEVCEVPPDYPEFCWSLYVLLIILLTRVSWWVDREGHVGLWSFSGLFFDNFKYKGLRFFFCIAFDLDHICSRLAALAQALLQNLLHLQVTTKCQL